jgi:hypothetical protein
MALRSGGENGHLTALNGVIGRGEPQARESITWTIRGRLGSCGCEGSSSAGQRFCDVLGKVRWMVGYEMTGAVADSQPAR